MKKFIILMMAALAILAVSCANDMPSTGGTIEQIQIPEVNSGNLTDDTLATVTSITNAITETKDFTDAEVTEYRQAMYVNGKLCAIYSENETESERSQIYDFVASAGNFKAGDQLIMTKDNNYNMVVTLNGKDVTESYEEIIASIPDPDIRVIVKGTSNAQLTIESSSVNASFEYDIRVVSNRESVKMTINLEEPVKNISALTIYHLSPESTEGGQSGDEITRCQINDAVYSVEVNEAITSIRNAVKAVCNTSAFGM